MKMNGYEHIQLLKLDAYNQAHIYCQQSMLVRSCRHFVDPKSKGSS